MIKKALCQALKGRIDGLSSGDTFRLNSIPISFRILRALGEVSIDHIGPSMWAVRKA